MESAEALPQLVAPGYVAPPVAAILTELVAQKPAEFQFVIARVEAEIRLGNLTRATTLRQAPSWMPSARGHAVELALLLIERYRLQVMDPTLRRPSFLK